MEQRWMTHQRAPMHVDAFCFCLLHRQTLNLSSLVAGAVLLGQLNLHWCPEILRRPWILICSLSSSFSTSWSPATVGTGIGGAPCASPRPEFLSHGDVLTDFFKKWESLGVVQCQSFLQFSEGRRWQGDNTSTVQVPSTPRCCSKPSRLPFLCTRYVILQCIEDDKEDQKDKQHWSHKCKLSIWENLECNVHRGEPVQCRSN